MAILSNLGNLAAVLIFAVSRAGGHFADLRDNNHMENDYLRELQHFVVDMYQSRCDKPLWVASEFCCSEMARYVGYKVLNDFPEAKAHILKSEISDKLSHDVLLVEFDSEFTIIDPTVWQIFKDSASIVTGEFSNIVDSLVGAKEIYKGEWVLSKTLERAASEKELPALLGIIDNIIRENCEEA